MTRFDNSFVNILNTYQLWEEEQLFIILCCGCQTIPNKLFRAMHSYNSVPNSDSEGHLPYFYLHIGVGHKVTKLLTCKYNVVYDF